MEMPNKSESKPALDPVQARRRRFGRRAFAIFGVILVAVVGSYVGYRVWAHGRISTDDALVEGDVVPLALRVGGVVKRIAVQENQRVKKGDLLLEIDPAELQVKVRQAEADLEAARGQADSADAQVRIVQASSTGGLSSARAQLAGSGAAVKTAHAQAAAAQAAVARADAEAHRAETALTRTKNLAAKGASTSEELEAAQTTYDGARAAADAARAQLAAAQEGEQAARSRVAEAAGHLEQSGPVDAQVAAAEAGARVAKARVATAEAALDQARLQLSYTNVVAPIDGRASRLAVQVGQNVAAGQLAIELVPDQTYVVANLKETDIGRVRPGQPVDIEIDALGGKTLQGKVESVSPATSGRFSLMPADNASGNFVKTVQRVPVKIEWTEPPPPELGLRPGLSVEVTIHVD